ncbi:short-chain dehydrogenase/reductase [Methylobacterium oxalidis]|uniref:Short-chain dehydrogenase/reductase n=1 Tax=Methylobacterium oxalidis TaxID=944322 RepID=A0A512JD13_9HYPH|nr:short-chain dehydrogenase/reductase [Methylobacterium oxalidis]GEP07815.1 short-chain dehydrogenase/reductase [Methylobacterium oxalidis]GJE34179.1 3-oxoacyl-[acyl-carrier-protein] reductase FabG [Methylobacterium oxalidis]GLS67552.1 short-chain dehydrogenase/reductase [Methylobacterium oxalidis]
MDLSLKGKRALITGGSKGIGLATAALLAEEGCDLVLVGRDSSSLAGAAQAQVRHGVGVQAIPADLSRSAEHARVVEEAGGIDILVNNAGAIPAGDFLAVDEATWRSAWDLKVFGYIDLTRAFYPTLKERGGVVVNVIGSAGERAEPSYIAGSSGNAALMAFTRALGACSPRDGVRVVGINPGPVATDRIEMLLRANAERTTGDAERWQDAFKNNAFGRAATPEEIAAAVAFLASPRSGYTSGVILTIDDPARVPL